MLVICFHHHSARLGPYIRAMGKAFKPNTSDGLEIEYNTLSSLDPLIDDDILFPFDESFSAPNRPLPSNSDSISVDLPRRRVLQGPSDGRLHTALGSANQASPKEVGVQPPSPSPFLSDQSQRNTSRKKKSSSKSACECSSRSTTRSPKLGQRQYSGLSGQLHIA